MRDIALSAFARTWIASKLTFLRKLFYNVIVVVTIG